MRSLSVSASSAKNSTRLRGHQRSGLWLAPQQELEILLFPAQCAIALRVKPLAFAECSGVDSLAAAGAALGRTNLVAHLVVKRLMDSRITVMLR